MIGYLDLPSGLSGDMFLGCLVDAGWPVQRLLDCITTLGLSKDDYTIEAREVHRCSLRALHVGVKTVETPVHRHLHDIEAIIAAAALPPQATTIARDVFRHLAEAEASVHGTSPDKVHFHEVGALDAIIDVVGAACGITELGISQLYASAVPSGSGWVECDHGRMPVPAPATLALLRDAAAPVVASPGSGELVTPTGAALLRTLARFEQPPMHLQGVGVGAGSRDCDWPNIARLWIGHQQTDGPMVQVETNIDDMNPQLFAAVSERLFAEGAVDVWMTPVQMKKSRPGVVLSVLAPSALESTMAAVMLRETTTLGVRARPVHRYEARRAVRDVATPYGPVAVKMRWDGDAWMGASPEYDSCAAVAAGAGVPVRRVYEAAVAAVGRFSDDDTVVSAGQAEDG